MTLTTKQEEGLMIAVARYKAHEAYTCISGYAGSGKSTLIKFIIAALGVTEDEVAYVAFTGKAANVLSQKGCPNAITAHKLLYYARQMPTGNYAFTAKKRLDNLYKVIVVDEVSMLPKPMWELLLSHKIYVLACGDPGQLPPIDKDADNHVLDNPHIFLDEIMRQAQDSEIIRLSMHIREGKSLSTFPCQKEQVQILNRVDVDPTMYEWADQVLCATNAKRTEINNIVRQRRGFGVEPEVGDKVISLKNHWEWASNSGTWALTNGSIGTIENLDHKTIYVPSYIYNDSIPIVYTTIKLDDDDTFDYVPIDYKALKLGKPTLEPRQAFLMNKNKNLPDPPFDFAYAYAITCHKAQGSEWSKVLVFEEWFPNVAEDHKRWLYTACTRASDKLVIIKK